MKSFMLYAVKLYLPKLKVSNWLAHFTHTSNSGNNLFAKPKQLPHLETPSSIIWWLKDSLKLLAGSLMDASRMHQGDFKKAEEISRLLKKQSISIWDFANAPLFDMQHLASFNSDF